jgi:proteasome accessory factor C
MAQEVKIVAVLRLIRLLLTPPAKNLETLSKTLEVHPRTVRRYIEETLLTLNFPVEKNPQSKCYSLPSKTNLPVNISYGLSIEEMVFLKDAFIGIQHNPLKDSLMKKLFQDSELKHISDAFVKVTNMQTMQNLGTAIREGKQVILKKYHSVESQTIKDRLIEPLQFVHQFTQVRGYEPATSKVKSYNVNRIEQVEVLDNARTYTGDLSPTDAFGLTEEKEIYVELELSEKAYLLLADEFPLCRPFMDKNGRGYLFRGTVRSFKGIGRFILSLPGEIKVLNPVALKEYLHVQLKKIDL